MKTAEQIAAEVLRDRIANPDVSAHGRVIKAAIIAAIKADRAQHCIATSASDRYEKARRVLERFAERSAKLGDSVETPFERELADSLREVTEPAVVEEMPDEIASRILARLDTAILDNYSMDALSVSDIKVALLEAAQAGIQTGWNSWEPENAPGLVDTRETQAIRIVFDGPPEHIAGRFVEVENEHGASIKAGQWFDRGDGCWVLAMTIVKEPTA